MKLMPDERRDEIADRSRQHINCHEWSRPIPRFDESAELVEREQIHAHVYHAVMHEGRRQGPPELSRGQLAEGQIAEPVAVMQSQE